MRRSMVAASLLPCDSMFGRDTPSRASQLVRSPDARRRSTRKNSMHPGVVRPGRKSSRRFSLTLLRNRAAARIRLENRSWFDYFFSAARIMDYLSGVLTLSCLYFALLAIMWSPYAFVEGDVEAGLVWLALHLVPPLLYLPLLGMSAVDHIQHASVTCINPDVLSRVSDHEIEVKRVRKRVLLQFRHLALELLRSSGMSTTAASEDVCRMIFDAMDSTGSGRLTFREFRESLDALEIYLSAPACKWFFSSLDKDGAGTIHYGHFEAAMKEEVFAKLRDRADAAPLLPLVEGSPAKRGRSLRKMSGGGPRLRSSSPDFSRPAGDLEGGVSG